eukprot:TRINITY_DN5160_c0_g1_i1.p1 TRINITY_DN5160_c0_g1~~TRINITY_DN5160_c0_g1_i1.p1  ORF type:complete len:229 (-),score=55.20 TRINITY_DN5160_c0_g1_i1:104-790(-)
MTVKTLFVALALVIALFGLVASGQNINNNTVAYGSCFNETQDQLLLASMTSTAQFFTVNAAVPFEIFWNFFVQASLFPTWNSLFVEMQTTEFYLCGPFDASYSNTPKINFPPNMTAPHAIVQMGLSDDGQYGAFAWQFQLVAANGTLLTFGRHSYLVQNLPDINSVSVSSFEKVAGPQAEEYSFEWAVALEESLLDSVMGVSCLERVYLNTGDLNPEDVKNLCDPFTP